MATKLDECNRDLQLPLVMLAYCTSVKNPQGAPPLKLYLEEKLGYLWMSCIFYPLKHDQQRLNQYALELRLRRFESIWGYSIYDNRNCTTNSPMVTHLK